MNRQEFNDYILSYSKRYGEYTTEELYQIGLAYRSLPFCVKKDFTWKQLVNILGCDLSAEGLRGYVYKRYNKELKTGTKPMFSMTNEQAQLYSAKQRVRDELNDYRKLIREKGRIDDFREHLCEEINKLKPLPICFEKINYKSNAKCIAMFGDLHIGTECSNHYNKYNYDIALKRVNKWLNNVLYYVKTHNIKEINFCNGGDLISGIIHRTIRIESEFDISQQIIRASEIVANVLNELSKYSNVVYHSVVDNHSRAVASKDEHIEAESFCKITDWYVRERLKDNKRVSFPNSNIDDGVSVFDLNNKKFVMIHGHLDNVSTALQGLVGMTKQYIDYILMFHLHKSNVHNFQNTRIFVNGSFVGVDTYAFNNRLFGEPVQKLLIFENDNIIDIDINVK